MKNLLLVTPLLLLLSCSSHSNSPTPNVHQDIVDPKPRPQNTEVRVPAVPQSIYKPLDYTFHNADPSNPTRDLWEVTLKEPVSEDAVIEIVEELKLKHPLAKERTFITFFVDGMLENAGYWSCYRYEQSTSKSEFTFGITPDLQKDMLTRVDPSLDIIWKGWDYVNFMSTLEVIHRKGNQYYLSTYYLDGSGPSEKEITKLTNTSFLMYDGKTEIVIQEDNSIVMSDLDGIFAVWLP